MKKAGAKAVLVGDRRQLQPIGGPGLDLVSRAVEATRVDNIVRQREAWVRDAITAFGKGDAAEGLKAFADHGLLVESQGAKAAIAATLDAAEAAKVRDPAGSILILAKSNAAVAAISRVSRERRKTAGLIRGDEISFTAVTSSGHATQMALAAGDRIRFLVRNDDLGVINGTTATVVTVSETQAPFGETSQLRIEADVGDRRIVFNPTCLADAQGRPRLGWAYASTIYGSQGLTVDNSIVYVDHTLSRHDIFVASSRARETTTLVVDSQRIDRHLASELPFDRQHDGSVFSEAQRREWLAERLSRAAPKISTLDVIEGVSFPDRKAERMRDRRRELNHEL
ncbi:ATP-dependent exoDNAse (exonuclease V) alpha subunit [Bradyrhizobium elkanii]|nr:ATP-dependent exoDNAse (exonuclease V) alpha subunit [Bradyrhizobium elkanii]